MNPKKKHPYSMPLEPERECYRQQDGPYAVYALSTKGVDNQLLASTLLPG